MKHLVIIGPVRCGKTTLSNLCVRKLATKYNVHLLVGDFIRCAYVQVFKKHWRYKLFWRPIKSVFPKFGKHMVEHILPRSDLDVLIREYMYSGTVSSPTGVFEMALNPKEAIALFSRKEYKIVMVASPNITPMEKFQIMKKSDKSAWNGTMSDDELLRLATDIIDTSKKMVAQANKYNIPVIDTSYDYHSKLKQFADNVELFLK